MRACGSVPTKTSTLPLIGPILTLLVLTIVACGGSTDGKSTTITPVARTTMTQAAVGLEATHGVALERAAFLSDNAEIVSGEVYYLEADGDLTITVTVENSGNVDEQQMSIVATLVSDSSAPQSQRIVVPVVKAGATAVIAVSALGPTSPGEKATLEIWAGPVPDEMYVGDNSLTATLIFR